MYAKWDINTYTISFDSNNGTNVNPINAEYGTIISAPNVPTREGYTFAGWYQEPSLTNSWDFATETVPASDITLYAKWNLNKYNVTFKDWNGDELKQETVEHGQSATAPSNPIRTGYTFTGWDVSFDNITDNIVVTATYKINEYTITFNSNGGSGVKEQKLEFNSKIVEPDEPKKEGHTFVGWYTLDNISWNFATDTVPASDITLYAKWDINEYTITFISNGGSVVPEQKFEYNSNIVEPTTPTREGYTFDGWYTDDETFESAWDFENNTVPVDGLTLYAKWTLNSYTITFDVDGGTPITSQSIDHGATATMPVTPTKTGHTFAGWYVDIDGEETFDFTKPITADLTLYAKWEVNRPPTSPGSGGSGGSGANKNQPPSTPEPVEEAPIVEKRQAKIIPGNEQVERDVVETEITRTTDNGKVIDEVVFGEEEVNKVMNVALNNTDTVRVIVDDIPNELADEVVVNVATSTVNRLSEASLNLMIEAGGVKMTIPQSTLQELGTNVEDLYFRIVPIRDESEKKTVVERVLAKEEVKEYADGQSIKAVGQPMMIETNYKNLRTLVQFPFTDIDLPADPNQRQRFLDGLVIIVEHSDGENVIKYGNIVYSANGQPVGFEIEIDKFSTFTFLQLDEGAELIDLTSYINGYSDQTFRPDKNLTRAELAATLSRNVSTNMKIEIEHDYPDVESDHWSYDDIMKMKALGLMIGDNYGRFRPEDTVNRAEIATVAARWNELEVSNSNAFEDTKGHWAAGYISATKEAGIINGYPDDTFRPNRPVTRAETVAILNLTFDRPVFDDVTESTWADVPLDHWAINHIESASRAFQAIIGADGSIQFVR